jgi:tetratricopeptide (TPR) repeat protein
MQAILDYYTVINNTDPGSGEVSADNYYLTDKDWAALPQLGQQRIYTWEKDYIFDQYSNDWSDAYKRVYYVNTVLDKLPTVARVSSNQVDWDNIKGQALLSRARSFLQIAFIWSLAYDSNTAHTDLGIPLRMSSDFNLPSVRSTLQETYDQIVKDLLTAIPLLPLRPVQVMRPCKPAAYALLGRTYLSMRKYPEAGLYADSCLQLYHTLLDYNTLNASASYPISQFNAEVIMEGMIPVPRQLNNSRGKIDSLLFQSYADNDLRKAIFFKNNNNGTYGFRGSYEGGGNLFDGIATDEVLLIRAEASARLGDITAALNDLNLLLKNRYKTNSFNPLTANDAEGALTLILSERRKELLMRGIRWMDIKRLNKEGSDIVLKRILNGVTYLLPPNDLRYALPIPEDIITLTGMTQNLR